MSRRGLRIDSVRIPGSGESEINEILHVLVSVYSFDVIKTVQRKCPDLSPRTGVVVGSPNSIDSSDPSADENGRVFPRWLAEAKRAHLENFWNSRPRGTSVGRAHERIRSRMNVSVLGPGGEEQMTLLTRNGFERGVES